VRNEPLAELDAAAARVRAALEAQFGPVQAIGAAFLEQRRQCLAAGAPLSPERLAGMREVIWHQLRLLPAADGAGVVAAPGVVAGKERHLEWWQRTHTAGGGAAGAGAAEGGAGDGAGEGFARIRLNLDPESIDLYDYLDMDWFTVPRQERRRCVYGPYVDFSGADRYVLAMTVPVADGGEFLGVAGADVLMARLEPELLAALRDVAAPAALVTAERRVIAANTPRWISGTRLGRLPAPGDGSFSAVTPVGADSGWLVAAAE
jgi:methyl-accepting chemotaxis protein-like sensor